MILPKNKVLWIKGHSDCTCSLLAGLSVPCKEILFAKGMWGSRLRLSQEKWESQIWNFLLVRLGEAIIRVWSFLVMLGLHTERSALSLTHINAKWIRTNVKIRPAYVKRAMLLSSGQRACRECKCSRFPRCHHILAANSRTTLPANRIIPWAALTSTKLSSLKTVSWWLLWYQRIGPQLWQVN